MNKSAPYHIYRYLPAAGLILLCACRATAPPPSAPQAVLPALAPTIPEVRQDDIPPGASPAVRAHLIKLREMRDLGHISDGEYQSRKAGLLGHSPP